jgi:hypothetical protein
MSVMGTLELLLSRAEQQTQEIRARMEARQAARQQQQSDRERFSALLQNRRTASVQSVNPVPLVPPRRIQVQLQFINIYVCPFFKNQESHAA